MYVWNPNFNNEPSTMDLFKSITNEYYTFTLMKFISQSLEPKGVIFKTIGLKSQFKKDYTMALISDKQ